MSGEPACRTKAQVTRRRTRFAPIIAGIATISAVTLSAGAVFPRQQESEDWTGAAVCARCHAVEYEAWRDSHHDLAMQPVSDTSAPQPEPSAPPVAGPRSSTMQLPPSVAGAPGTRLFHGSVLGKFDGRQLRHDGITSTFFRRDGAYWVETDGPDNKRSRYRVAYVFGVHPLQQYLVALPGGRLQALDIAWDTRATAAGGQRWFHLREAGGSPPGQPANPEAGTAEQPDTRHTLHWTGTYYNWNARCAECHSTNLSKGYDAKSGTYATTWSEINVACEACHGPGRRHVTLADAGRLQDAPNSGLETAFPENGAWAFVAGETIASRSSPLKGPHEVENCARCHARRTSLAEYRHGADFLDTYLPSLLEEGLYFSDGQIREEVYVYGSFIQSRMYQAGVTCSDCHDPHSLALRAPGNAVCTQCHLPSAYDDVSHHHHGAQSPGAACVNCHMPATTYMKVDPRRDHSFQVPRPELSAATGAPNACNKCHEDRTAAWAAKALAEWGISAPDTSSHPSVVLQNSRMGDRRAAQDLQTIATDEGTAPIWRATAAAELGRFPSQGVLDSIASLLASDDALLRVGAVRAVASLPWQQRLHMLKPHLRDPVTAVRIEIARVLAEVPLARADERVASALEALFDAYLQSLTRNADMPEALAQRGDFLAARRLWKPAEDAYRNALKSDPQYVPALLNLADLYRMLGRDDDARTVLRRAIDLVPGQAAAHHALGLLETRAGNRETALESLERAAAFETSGVRYRYVHAIALHDSGDPHAAIEALEALLRVAPGNADILLALVNYSRGTGRLQDARTYAAKLRDLLPHDPAIRRLYKSL